MCVALYTRKRNFVKMSNLAWPRKHSIMVAVLMLLYHAILSKFILYLKSQFWENNRSKPVLITLSKMLCGSAYISVKS